MSNLATHTAISPASAHAEPGRRRLPRRQHHRQRGAFMLEISLAMVLTAIAAIGTMRTLALSNRMQMADIQADVIRTYAKALQTYTDENYIQLQVNGPVTKNGVTLNPGTALGQNFQPDIPSLTTMGYLPTGFTNDVILVDSAGFRNQIVLSPPGCVSVACNVRGVAYIDKPVVVRNSGGETDGVLIGEILARIGGDAGTSVEGSTGTISGVGGGWNWVNPVAGAPAGVVASKFGFDASALGQFVRINDTRDPALQGNLSALGNLNIGGTSTLAGATTVGGPLTVNNATTLNGNVGVLNGGGTNCINLDRNGIVTISCAGQLNARTGIFTDGLGNTSTIGPTGVTATGHVSGALGLSTASGKVFDSLDQYAITVNAGQQFFKGASGLLTLMTLDNGDVVAGRNVSGQRLAIQSNVAVGAACANTSGAVTGAATEYAATANGGMAVCSGGKWVGLNAVATVNSPCPTIGSIATDAATGVGMVCQGTGGGGGYYIAMNNILSNFVMGTPFAVTSDGFNVTKSSVISCAAHGAGAATGEPLVYLIPQKETIASGPGILQGAAFSRTATDSNPGSNAGSWTFSMKDGAGKSLTQVSAIAVPYCLYY